VRVEFVGHASLLVRYGNFSLLSDPWWAGPAYRDQWYPYPIPVPERYDLSQLDAVYISHSHEDHLHAPTLRKLLELAPHVQALIPLRHDTQMRDYLRRIGFRRISELASGTPFVLGKNLRLTLFTHLDDSLLAVQSPDGETLLNLNDALHSSRRELILEYCRILRNRFPNPNYLFCGFGGASYFPNCVHVPGKDDLAVARAREQYFLQNFALIAEQLKPQHAFPFAAHFVLPDQTNWWMSVLRLQMDAPSKTLASLTSVSVHDLQPGDYVESGTVHASPLTRPNPPEVARQTVLDHFGPAPARPPIDEAAFADLLNGIRTRLSERPATNLDAVILLSDYAPKAIRLQGTTVEPIDPASIASVNPRLTVETRSDLIRSTLRTPFGKDLISIGYGGQFTLRSSEDLASAPHDKLLNLLSPVQPRWRQHLRERPLRTLRYLLGDPSMRYAVARRVLRHKSEAPAERAPYDLRDWVAAPEA
jgi:beta-lactamase family protein